MAWPPNRPPVLRFLRRKGLDARLLMFHAPKLRSDVPDIVLNVPDGLWRRQGVQARAFARVLPDTDLFHFYFGHTLVPRRIQFPLLRLTRRKSLLHYLGSDIRGKPRTELAWGKRADAEIVGSWDAHRWVPEAHVVPPPIDLSRYAVVPPPENERVLIAQDTDRRRDLVGGQRLQRVSHGDGVRSKCDHSGSPPIGQ